MNPSSRAARLSRAMNRRRSRGAALVEAAVAIPVMLSFLGLTMYIHNSYDEKLASQTSTRAQVLYYASHNCDGSVPQEMAVQLGTKTSGAAPGKKGQNDDVGAGNADELEKSKRLGENTAQGASREWNLAKTHRETQVGGTAVEEQKKVTLGAVKVTSDSEVACNEKRYDNSWTAVFGFIKDFVRSGAGI